MYVILSELFLWKSDSLWCHFWSKNWAFLATKTAVLSLAPSAHANSSSLSPSTCHLKFIPPFPFFCKREKMRLKAGGKARALIFSPLWLHPSEVSGPALHCIRMKKEEERKREGKVNVGLWSKGRRRHHIIYPLKAEPDPNIKSA